MPNNGQISNRFGEIILHVFSGLLYSSNAKLRMSQQATSVLLADLQIDQFEFTAAAIPKALHAQPQAVPTIPVCSHMAITEP